MNTAAYAFRFAKIVGSAIAQETKATLLNVAGLADLTDPSPEAEPEISDQMPEYSGVGPVFRPLDPERIKGKNFFTETVCAVTDDGLVPIGFRDMRIWKAFPSGLQKGQTAFAGYGGGFYSLSLTSSSSGSQKANIHVMYCPYQFDANGVPSKAHAIVLDPENQAISITHADGAQISLLQSKEIMMVSDGSTWMQMKPGVFNVQAAQIGMVGSVYVGDPTLAMPLVKFNEFATLYDAHVHPTAMGPSGPPAVLMTPLVTTIGTLRALGL